MEKREGAVGKPYQAYVAASKEGKSAFATDCFPSRHCEMGDNHSTNRAPLSMALLDKQGRSDFTQNGFDRVNSGSFDFYVYQDGNKTGFITASTETRLNLFATNEMEQTFDKAVILYRRFYCSLPECFVCQWGLRIK